MEKLCSRCRIVKNISEFSPKGQKHQSRCKSCQREIMKKWREDNPEQSKSWYRQNSKHHHNLVNRWRKNNPEKEREIARRARSKETHKANIRAWEVAHPGNALERAKKWQKNNPGKASAACSKRRASKLNATPVWADLEAIKEIYNRAKQLQKETGTKWHVDHIVPLKSNLVSGFHVENNLQIIPALENIVKSNRYWPNMPSLN